MFTGIIRATAPVVSVRMRGGNHVVAITAPRGWKLREGSSVAIDGICSTVVRNARGTFEVVYMPETLRMTTAASFEKGTVVNLEEPLRVGDALDGHFVQGHVDGAAAVARIARTGDSREITFRVPPGLRKCVAQKGSITVNGVALTVARMEGGDCTVALIPYTLVSTNLGALRENDRVNLEADLIARYLARLARK
jgi:riboflavin synthase